ncbi:hypothetical protein FRC06_004865, partial [Ceratobasidium sp. 370]
RKLGDEHVDTLDSEHELTAAQQRDNLEEVKLHYTQITSPHERMLGTQLDQVLEAQNFELPAANLTETAPCISAETSVSDAFDYLVRHACLDLTSQLDLSSCPDAALSGGRFGDVWRGRLLDWTQVAIKCLRLHTAVNSKAIKVRSRFELGGNPRSPQQHAARELYFWSKLKHSNVLELLGFAMFQGQLAMISPWMEKGTLNDHIRRHPALDRWALVRHVPTPKEPLTPFKLYQCLQISEGLEYIHEVGMVHGDLKANNILVSAEGVVKLSDFGNSVMANHSLAFSPTSIAGGGTARWMAPELIKREDGTTADRSMPADIYAFGMTILVGNLKYLPFLSSTQLFVPFTTQPGNHHQRRDMPASEQAIKRWRSPESFEGAPSDAKRPRLHSETADEILQMTHQAEEYESQGRWRQAAELKLKLSQKSFGDNHPDTFKAMHLLANAYAQQGLFRTAATLQLQATSIWIQSMECITLLEAESLQSDVLSLRRRSLGETSADTLWAMYQLAMIYHEQGRLKEAQRLDKEVQQSGRKHLPPSIYETIEQNKPKPSELEQLAMAALARAVRDLVSQESKLQISLAGGQGTQTDLPGSQADGEDHSEISCGTLESMGYEHRISTKTPMDDVFKLLVNSCCLDLTDKIDPSQCPTAPYAGGRFGDVWCGVFEDQTKIAIKCLRLHTGSDASVKNVKRAARELYYWSKAKHKNVLELTGIAIFRKRLAMISPWMANGTLHAYIHKHLDANR